MDHLFYGNGLGLIGPNSVLCEILSKYISNLIANIKWSAKLINQSNYLAI